MASGRGRIARRRVLAAVTAAGLAWAVARPVAAHGGSLGGAARESVTVPAWLLVATGGAVVGASFLLASFATDRELVAALHERRRPLRVPARGLVVRGGQALGLVVLGLVLASGFAGPATPGRNAAVLVVWAGWWAGFTMSTYLLGNAWPVVNPWRTLLTRLPSPGRTYEWRWGAWPSVAGLLALVWLEVVSPLADDPRVLATTVAAYSLVTLGGALVYGADTWFESVDPVARVFRLYGAVAPVGPGSDGTLSLRLPGSALTGDLLDGLDEVAFVVALLWVTTYDGLVATPAWRSVAIDLVGAGVPAAVLYPAALVVGFALFLWAYLTATALARRTAETYLSRATLARRFAPPLLAIAAGYHVAHFAAYFLQLSPALVTTVTSPLADVPTAVAILPDWFGVVAIAGVLVGHVLAVAAAHAVSFDLFPGRLQAIRSQYPFVAVMIVYTMVSLWIVSRPDATPPFI